MGIDYVGELAELAEEALPGSRQNQAQVIEYLQRCGLEVGYDMPDEARAAIMELLPDEIAESHTSVRIRDTFKELGISTWTQVARLSVDEFYAVTRWNTENVADVERNLARRGLRFSERVG